MAVGNFGIVRMATLVQGDQKTQVGIKRNKRLLWKEGEVKAGSAPSDVILGLKDRVRGLSETVRQLLDDRKELVNFVYVPPHANIVRFLGVVLREDGNDYVMEWAKGGSLHELLSGPEKSVLRKDMPRVVRLLVGVLNALSHLHAQGFVHRDLKPGGSLLCLGLTVLLQRTCCCRRLMSKNSRRCFLIGVRESLRVVISACAGQTRRVDQSGVYRFRESASALPSESTSVFDAIMVCLFALPARQSLFSLLSRLPKSS